MEVNLDKIECIKDTSITIRDSRRRVTVPSEVVKLFKLKNGDKLRWIVFKNGVINVQKIK